ncbi:cytochrome P450 [Altererythrobacter sp. FM1]|uniref:cytochrome P450 n=1 Tax=Tsuneonella flava TaxID=2055955 RepID=UPI000C7FD877|nr:cytochrome P450 [Tsuneonella flava]ROT93923.1 cytochrome P450 [Altererythrobacter sp. FM1]
MLAQNEALPRTAREIGNAITATSTYTERGAYDRLFTHLRQTDPVAFVEPDGFAPFWAVTKHADIQEVERTKDVFINAPRILLRSIAVDEQIKKVTGGRPFLMRNLTNLDGVEHSKLRRLTQSWFMPSRLQALEADLRQLAKVYVDRMVAMDGQCDFIRDVASWYPLRVIMRILGVPAEDEPKMLQLTQQIFGPDDPDIKTEKNADIIATVNTFFDYFRVLTEDRRKNPTDDVATVIAQAEIDGEPIGDLEALSYYILVATAGHDTTSSTTAGGMLALVENPDQLALLKAEPERLPAAIEEMLRWVTPVTHFFRTATEDYELRGKRIRAGDSLMMCYPSANRDEDVFEDPFRFDITRSPNKHISFGYGPHVCLGQHLAKMEIRIFFEELLSRVDGFELDGEPQWLASNFVGGLKRFPLRFSVAA